MRSDVEELSRRHSVRNTDGVESRLGHLAEVAVDLIQILVLQLVVIRPERAVRRTAHPQLFVADTQELPAHDRSIEEGLAKRRSSRLPRGLCRRKCRHLFIR